MLLKLNALVYINLLLCQMLFFSVFAVLGLTYKGASESNVYSIYLVGSSFLAYFFIFLDLRKINYFKPVLYVFILLPLVFLLFFFLAPSHDFVNNQAKIFFVLVVPSIFIGYIIPRKLELSAISKGFLISAIIVVIGVLRIIPRIISLPVIELLDIFGGGQYQAFSYFCALSFLVVFRNFLIKNDLRLWGKAIYLFALLVLTSGVILSGGRGGFVVVFVGMIIFTVRYKGIIKFSKYLVGLICIIYVILQFSKNVDWFLADRINESFDRLFSFISSDGINMEGTSNREDFYEVALSLIEKNPIIGFGLFGTVKYLGDFYPHNLFLEILLQGGLLYFMFFLLISIYFIYRLLFLIRHKRDEDLILITTIYSGILLMFSGSYIQEPLFWFSLSYVISYPSRKNLLNEKEENINTNC